MEDLRFSPISASVLSFSFSALFFKTESEHILEAGAISDHRALFAQPPNGERIKSNCNATKPRLINTRYPPPPLPQ